MSDTDLVSLYSGRILALAADIPRLGKLAAPQGSAKKRSPLCGSTVSVDVQVQDGKITDFAQDVRACALGQASAAILAASIIGRTRSELQSAHEQLSAMLKSAGPVPGTPFEGFEVLLPARDYRNRHASILLALEATIAAMEAAEAS